MSDELITPPWAEDSEAALLGEFLWSPVQPEFDIEGGLEAFYDSRNRALWAFLVEWRDRGHPWQPKAILRAFAHEQPAMAEYARELKSKIGGPSSYHRQRLKESMVARRALKFAHRTTERIRDKEYEADDEGFLARLEGDLQGIHCEGTVITSSDYKEGVQILLGEYDRVEALNGRLAGYSTGLIDLDRKTQGLHPGDLMVIGARPSMGKTALGATIAGHTGIECSVPTLFISLESSKMAIWNRILCATYRMPIGSIRSSSFAAKGRERLKEMAGRRPIEPTLWVEQHLSGLSSSRLQWLIRRYVRRHGVKIVIVDYLQKLRADSRQEKRTYEVGEVSGALKAAAVENNVAVIALAQLNRDAEEEVPRMSDLADSGQIERDADVIVLLHRRRDDPDALLIVAKQRDGMVGTVKAFFAGAFCRFENAAPAGMEEHP